MLAVRWLRLYDDMELHVFLTDESVGELHFEVVLNNNMYPEVTYKCVVDGLTLPG